ncbi:MAG: hypothetical protein JO353_08600 [Phycisphaerae bacterium]|nr:hypothetical protein [Phycisphaerae bacterium]
MHTAKQIDRLWKQARYIQLFNGLTMGRLEADFGGHLQASRPAIAAAAMAIIRLDELAQPNAAVYPGLLRVLLGAQESDGGWGEPMLTALCVRALLSNGGNGGAAIHNGLTYLANLQQETGIWPRVPIRRFAADPLASVFILSQLGHEPQFREAVHFAAAADWFAGHSSVLDQQTRKLWTRVESRTTRWQRQSPASAQRLATLWT